MKQPKRLTREQKKCLSAHHLNADNWMLMEETKFYLKIINKQTGEMRFVDKFRKHKEKRGVKNDGENAGNKGDSVNTNT